MSSIRTCSVGSMPPIASKISPSTLAIGLQHALAAVARLVAVAQFHRLVRAGGGAGRHRRAAERAAVEHHVDLDGRIAAAVEDLAGDDVGDGGHGFASVPGQPFIVMPGLGPGTHVLRRPQVKTWVAGPSPAMTVISIEAPRRQ